MVAVISGVALSADQIITLCYLATGSIVLMWLSFWFVAWKSGERIRDILASAGFFRAVAIMGVVAATVVLSLAGGLESQLTAAILSGIAGYVLGATLRPSASGGGREGRAGAGANPGIGGTNAGGGDSSVGVGDPTV